ncbi:MAG: glycosyltransferase family 4 protein [bacterium]
MNKRILLIASLYNSLYYFRGDFIKELIDNGYEVYTLAPNLHDKVNKQLTDLGAQTLEFDLSRTGINPLKDLKSINQLKHIIKEYKIDLVFPYTIKPVIYGSIAANKCNVPVISLITGLGFTFTGISRKARLLQKLNETLYRFALKKNKYIVFQNDDDRQLFYERKILNSQHKTDLVSGSGINLNRYPYRENNKITNDISFVIVARMIAEKGIALFIDAAKKLKEKYPEAQFHLIGSPLTSPTAIKEEVLLKANEEGTCIYHGSQNDISGHLTAKDIFVLPSYYREGIPRSILEALSIGMPIITTKTPGCKETVKKDYNGILIEPRSLDPLIEAMEFFLMNKEKIKEYGSNSRTYAEERFDVNIINKHLLKLIDKTLK